MIKDVLSEDTQALSPRQSSSDKYEPLREYLAGQLHQNRVSLTFKEIEVLLGDSLPEPAYSSSAEWWTNEAGVPDAPQSRVWLESGFGVSLVAHQTDTSGWVEFVRGLQRWSGVAVDSKQLGQKPVDERLHELALGYLQSARLLCIVLGEHPDELSWPRASVICFCYWHAVELFLKCCILHRTPTIETCSHVRVVTISDLLPITIIDGSRGLHTAELPVASSLWS